MKICPKCEVEHSKPGRFCSRKCGNARVWSEETQKKRSASIKAIYESWTDEQKKAHGQKGREKMMQTKLKKLMEADFNTLEYTSCRKRVLIEQDNKCNRCGLSEWQGEKLTLEIDHKDGNHSNNVRENLEGLCPNCHSLTPTWRGRNRKANSPVI